MTLLLKRFAVLCVLGATILGVSFAQAVPGLSIKGDSTKKDGTKEITEGNVVVEYLGSVLKAERAVFDTASKKIDARGNVILIPKGGTALPPFPGLLWDVSKPPGIIQPYTAAQAAAKPAPAKPAPTKTPTPAKPAPTPAVVAKPVPTPTPTPVKPAPTPSVTSKPVAPAPTKTPALPPKPAVTATPVKPAPTPTTKPAVTATPVKPVTARPTSPTRTMIPRELAQSNGKWFLPGMEVSGKSVSRGGNLQSAEGDARVSYNGTVIDAGKLVMNKATRVIDAHNGVTVTPKGGSPIKFDRVIWTLTNPPGVIQPYSASLTVTPVPTPPKPPVTSVAKPAPVKPAPVKPAPTVVKPVVPTQVAAPRASFVEGLTWTSKTISAAAGKQTATDVTFNYAGMVIKAPNAVIDTKGKVIDATGGVTLTQDGGEPMKFSAIKWDLSTPPGTIQPIITAP